MIEAAIWFSQSSIWLNNELSKTERKLSMSPFCVIENDPKAILNTIYGHAEG